MKHSQLAPLPEELPFRIVSKTIGQGAYACIKKAAPLSDENPVFAVKFIHKDYAARHGHVTVKQIQMEVALHEHVGVHKNIIEFFDTGENEIWRWIAMELAEGGDLFDKIEADEGVGEDIAHVYFTQLISAIEFMHTKGVGHRDIKPENILLCSDGNLKIADFGLATLFKHNGKTKMCTTLCGSPPYIAPEVIQCSNRGQSRGAGYMADLADIWSCGIVLFVLLVGNTPWDSPTDESYEYCDYVNSNAEPEDELWHRLPVTVLSLLRGMMKVDAKQRFSMEDVRNHDWFKRKSNYLSDQGKIINTVNMATTMFESLHIDFNQNPHPLSASQARSSTGQDEMVIDSQPTESKIKPSTQPQTSSDDMLIDWDDGPPRLATSFHSASQSKDSSDNSIFTERLMEDPSMSQFSATPSVPLSRTQMAQRFRDIIPSSGLTRFFSNWSLPVLVPHICEALQALDIPTTPNSSESSVLIQIRTVDDRKSPLRGNIIAEAIAEGIVEVEFVKTKGDPLEWRRFFKKVAVLCKNAVLRPET